MILNVNGDSLPGPLIIGTFEKRASGVVSSLAWFEPSTLAQKSDALYKPADSNTSDFFITCGENLAATGWDVRGSSESLSISLSEAEKENNQKEETK